MKNACAVKIWGLPNRIAKVPHLQIFPLLLLALTRPQDQILNEKANKVLNKWALQTDPIE